MNNSEAVYQLQKLHNELIKVSLAIAGFKKAIEDDSSVRLAEITLRAQRGTLLKNEQDQKKLDADSSTLSTKIREDETRLYNGKVKSPKEMVELQQEIAHQKQRLTELEERSFECLTENETLAANVAKAEAELRNMLTTRSSGLENLRADAEESTSDLKKLKASYNEHRAALPAEIIAHFDRLLLSKNNIAVALVDDDSCGVCGTLLSKQVILSSRSAASPNVCPTCNRMLYHEH